MNNENYFTRLSNALSFIDTKDLSKVVERMRKSKRLNGTIWIFGNGGSFANAQHWVCDFQKVACIRAMMLGDNGPLLTALSNDESYENAITEELNRVARFGDLLIVLSCSGCSSNITRLLMKASEMSISSILFTGDMNTSIAQSDCIIRIKSDDYGIIEDCHSAVGHWLTYEMVQ